jgi:predicted RNase H-like HicB family nuclease
VAEYTAVFVQISGGWLGYIEELPSATAQGDTLSEARDNLEKAIRHVIANHREYVRKEVEGRSIVVELLDIEP